MAKDTDAFSIVVVGAMNPMIHHPAWYRSVGILEEDTARAVAPGGRTIVTAEVAQFELPGITINCLPNRWQASTEEAAEKGDAVLELACKTFERLQDTPVRAFGFNFSVHRATPHESVKARLASLVRGIGLGVDDTTEATASLSYRSFAGSVTTGLEIQPSTRGDEFVYVAVNRHHDIQAAGTHFDLTLLVRDAIDADRRAAYLAMDRVVRRVSRED
jgi:hypothetical protein